MEWLIVLTATPLGFAVSLAVKKQYLMPVLGASAVYWPFLRALQKSPFQAFAVVLFWTLVQSALVITYSRYQPIAGERIFWRAGSYAEAMFRWIETGVLPEGNNAAVVVVHLKQAAGYCVLALVSGNLLSLILGCALLNFMNYYVARLSCRFRSAPSAILMGWNPWSVIRVASFLWLGVVLGIPLLSRLLPLNYGFRWWYIFPGLAGIVADLVLKIGAGGYWSSLLKARVRRS